MKFQDKLYDIVDRNKCPSCEKSAEKCILRKSYFHHSEPNYDLWTVCRLCSGNQHHSTFLRHRTRVTAAPLGPVTLLQLYFPTRIPAELRRLTSSVVGSSLSSSCRISQIKISRYLAHSTVLFLMYFSQRHLYLS